MSINGVAWAIIGVMALFAVAPFVKSYFARRRDRKIRRIP